MISFTILPIFLFQSLHFHLMALLNFLIAEYCALHAFVLLIRKHSLPHPQMSMLIEQLLINCSQSGCYKH